MSEYIEPDGENMAGPDELPDTAWLARLQTVIHDAAVGGPTATEFVERLLSHGVRLIAQTSRSGRVSGVSYEYEEHVVKGSGLGPAYTWSGVQKRLGVTYVRQRDQAALEGRLNPPESTAQPSNPVGTEDIEPPEQLPWAGREDVADRTNAAPSEPERLEPTSAEQPSTSPNQSDVSSTAAERDNVQANASTDDQFTAEQDSLVAKSWEEWAIELEHEIASDDADDRSSDADSEPDTVAESSPESRVAESNSTASNVSTITVETEQWQALISAVGELRDQVRTLDARLAELAPSPAEAERAVVGSDGLPEQLAGLTASVRQASHATEQATEAMTRAKYESLWMSMVGASIAGLLGALLVGLWLDQAAVRRVDAMQQAVIDHMERQAAEDPLRQYFDRIVKKLQRP